MNKKTAGFTLLEVTIASALSAFTILAAMSMLKTFQRGNARAMNRMGSLNEITEIKQTIQSAFRSRISLKTKVGPPPVPMGDTILSNLFPWEVSQHFLANPLPYTQAWSAESDTNLGECKDLLVRRHRPSAFPGNVNTYTGVEELYFVNHCTQQVLPPGTTQLFTNGSTTDLGSCPRNAVQFRIDSYLHFRSTAVNDAPIAAPVANDPVIHHYAYPQDTLRGRNIAVCFRLDPKRSPVAPGGLTSPTAIPPFFADGTSNPAYPRNLFVEIRAQIFSGDDFSSGRFTTAVDKFVIPIPNSNVELIPAVSSP